MDRKALIEKLKGLKQNKRKAAVYVTGGLSGVMALTLAIAAAPHVYRQAKFVFNAQGRLTPRAVIERYLQAFGDVEDKVNALRTADVENQRLRLENAHLRLKLESVQFDCHSRDAISATHEFELKLNGKTGSKVGRTLASINYKPPGHLLPPQLYTLGVSYFKAREDEKAAVILTFLTGLEESDAFKTPKNFLMTGISWYRVDNFDLADWYFGEVLKSPDTPESQPYHAQARLWRGLVAERLGMHKKAQDWLRELVDHHPHSTEAAWVNSTEAVREPASED